MPPLLPGDPKPDAEIDVVFGFLLKVGYRLLSLVVPCTLK